MLRRIVLLSAAPALFASLIAAMSLAPTSRPRLNEETLSIAGVGARLYAPENARQLILAAPGWGESAHRQEAIHRALAARGFLVLAIDDGPAPEPPTMRDEATIAHTLELSEARTAASAARLSAALELIARHPKFGRLVGDGRVGVFGYSIGGAAAAEAAIRDPRIGAVINLDGWLFGRAAREPPPCAYLWALSRESLPRAAADGIERMRRRDLAVHRRFAGRRDVRWMLARRASHHALGGPNLVSARADFYASFFRAAAGDGEWARFEAAAPAAGYAPVTPGELGDAALDTADRMPHPSTQTPP